MEHTGGISRASREGGDCREPGDANVEVKNITLSAERNKLHIFYFSILPSREESFSVSIRPKRLDNLASGLVFAAAEVFFDLRGVEWAERRREIRPSPDRLTG